MTARCVMVLGTHSGAGKSLLATALCRWYADAGHRVRPFKAQNMSNNARVVATPAGDAGEMGAAQYFQALAARAEPDVRMNPVLLKPEADTRSQVVVTGHVRHDLGSLPWRERSALLWPEAERALRSLREDADVIVIEGAGSPAEINLAASDYVNTRTALAAEAACLLVSDIDRGGAFAHLYGTHALMDSGVRRLLRGFVLNKFRGDAALLAPAPQELQRLTGVPTVAVLPMLRDHGLPEEDGVFESDRGGDARRTVGVVFTPHVSNLDEFQPLRRLRGWHLRWVREPRDAEGCELLVLPGSKHTRADLAWLRERGMDRAIAAHVQAGRRLIAICGGLQMAGVHIDDPHGVEGGTPGHSEGLGLLPLHTRFGRTKRLARTQVRFAPLPAPWQALSHLAIDGYEIRVGRTRCQDNGCAAVLPDNLGWQRGPVLAVYLHGLFEQPSVLRALFGAPAASLDHAFDRLAAAVDESFAPGVLHGLLR